MNLIDRKELIRKMNHNGMVGRPFLFIAGYDEKLNLIWDLDKIPHGVKYSTPWNSNNFDLSKGKEITILPHPPSWERYEEAFSVVMKNIRHGNSYLLNLTMPTLIEFDGTLRDIYEGSSALYKLLIPELLVLFSPEIFVRIEDDKISGFPMKGTIDASVKDATKYYIKRRKGTG